MANENYGFCPACGANLPADSTFCPECGHNLAGPVSSGQEAGAGVGYGYSKPGLSGKLKTAAILCLIYAILEVLGSFSLLSMSMATIDMLDDMMGEDGWFENMLNDMGYDMTAKEFVDMCHITGIISLVSGVFAGIGSILCFKLRKKMIAVGLVVAASLVLLVGCMYPMNIFSTIIDVIIGLLMAYLIYSSPDQFAD